ncbi:MAG: hypothetical protein WA152_02650 [Microgenomates group bacterium]
MSDKFNELTTKQIAVNTISANRLNVGVHEPGKSFESGCAFIALSNVYKVYNPEKPVPRLFMTEPIKFAPNLEVTLPQFLDFVVQNKEKLGFEVDKIVIDAMRFDDFLQTEAFEILNKRDEIVYLEYDPEDYIKGIYKSDGPMAIVCFDNEGDVCHMEAIHGSIESKKKVMDEMKEYEYSTPIYVAFKRT